MMNQLPEDQFSISDKAFDKSLSRRENLEALRRAGFSHIHFSHKWREESPLERSELEDWKRDLMSAGIAVLDVHGCHPRGMAYNLWSESGDARKLALDLFRHRLEVTHELGGDAMVYHVPCHVEGSPQLYARFMESLSGVEDFALGLGVSVALENHYELIHDREAFVMGFSQFNPQFLTFTFDPGHAQIADNFDWLLEHCVDRLRILHLNDNDGTNDRHWNPYFNEGITDWQAVVQAIARSPYEKPIQLEVSWHPEKHPSHEEFLREARAAAGRIASAVNILRAGM